MLLVNRIPSKLKTPALTLGSMTLLTQGSFLLAQSSTELLLRASDYDAEQHYYPNAARSGVMGGLPGSSHPLVFDRDENGAFLYLDQSTLAHLVSTPIANSDTSYRIEGRTTGVNDSDRRMFLAPLANGFQRSVGRLAIFNNTAAAAYSSSNDLYAQLSISPGEPFYWRYVVDGTSLDIDVSTDGTTWTSHLSTTMSANMPLGTGTVYIGSNAASAGQKFRTYAVTMYDAPTGGSEVFDFDPSLFQAGNRGHAATATDAQGNVWTVSRAGSPLSVIDTKDGNGPGVRFAGASGQYLYSLDRAALELSASDVLQIDLEMAADDWSPSSNQDFFGKYLTTGNQRSWRVELQSNGELRIWVSTDGTATAFADSSVLPFTDGTKGHIRIVWTIGTGFSVATSTDGSTYTTLDASVALTEVPFDSTANLTIGGFNNGTGQPGSGDVFSASLTLNSAVVSAFDAAQINRRQWRCDRTVDSTVEGEAWLVTFTDSAEDSNDPVFRDHTGAGNAYIWMDGTSTSNYLSSDIAQSIANGSVISVRAEVAPDDWSPVGANERIFNGGVFFSHNTSGGLLYAFDGVSSFPSANSSEAVPFVNGQRMQVRADHDHTNDTVDFYWRDPGSDLTDDTGWTALGTQQAITNEDLDTTLTGGTATVLFGNNVAGELYTGRLYKGCIIDDGTVACSFDPNDHSGNGTQWTDATTGETVFITRATSGFATAIVTQDVVLFGGSHNIVIPYISALSTMPLTVGLSGRIHNNTTSWRHYFSTDGVATAMWRFTRHSTNARFYMALNDGTTGVSIGDNADNITYSTKFSSIAAMVSGDQEHYSDGASTETSSATLTSLDGGDDLWIGADPDGGDDADCFEWVSGFVMSKRATTAEIVQIHNELVAV